MHPQPLKFAGVPEAFNDPWLTASFPTTPAPQFQPHPGGSGSMLKSLQSGTADAAFALTDCIIAAIENGDPVRLLGPLVTSPLTWAVIVGPNSTITDVEQLSHAKWGVSRIGSGSQVMVRVLAKKRGWEKEPTFQVCGNFEGLRKAINDGSVDAFLWEHYTTRPFEVDGEVRIVGRVPTPWGCFSVVVTEGCERLEEIRRVVDAFLKEGKQFVEAGEESVAGIVKRHGMSVSEAGKWLEGVKYAEMGTRYIGREEADLTRRTLLEAGVIQQFRCEGGVDGYYA